MDESQTVALTTKELKQITLGLQNINDRIGKNFQDVTERNKETC